MLRPASVEAQPEAWLAGMLFGISAVVFILTSAALLLALARRSDPRPPTVPDAPRPGDRGRIRAVVTAVAATVVVLAVVVAASLAAGPRHETFARAT